ncbi:MAG TPA: hypothetical protein VHI99_24665 [Vicinamibacterales bacterium]|jgi:hypothetical protein|nr:hypothetical protein [Vicinamibacterales bacterium]
MPRKQRSPKPRIDLPLSKAWHFALMTGTPPQCRLPGWVEFEYDAVKLPTGDYSWTAAGDALWQQHGAALTREAAAAAFVPFWSQQEAPAGAGFRQWRDAFLAEHRY